jgi:UDP-glucose 4-epimerase
VKHALVTGGNGFIGRYVVEELVARGWEVAVLDTRNRETIPGSHIVLGDVRDATAVTEAVAHSDGVIHLAGVLGTQETILNPRPAAETNIIGGLNVLEAVVQYKLPAVNIAVGNHWMNNTYAITKSTMERFADMMNRFRGGRIAVVRALNAYGPRQTVSAPYGPSKVRKVMPSFICRALAGEPIEIYGDGGQVMDMIFVSDVARVLVTALERTATGDPPASGEVYQAGTGRQTTINEIASVVARTVSEKTRRAPTIVRSPMRPGEDERSVVLGDPLTLAPLGIRPEHLVTLEEGVGRTVDYFIEYMAKRP